MEIFKVSIKNKDLELPFEALYFEEQRSAEAMMNVFNQMSAEGKVIEWECERINAMSHKETFNQMMAIGDEFPD
jgi:hypothetical protein